MRLLAIVILSLLFVQKIHADEFAKLRIKIAGTSADNRYFLCVSNIGCISIEAGNHGKTYPLTPGNLRYIYATNVTNLRLYPQPLPDSCNIDVKSNQTITVSGRMIKGANDSVYVRDLNCRTA